MRYTSTRGGVTGLTFEEALFSSGYVADGGILMPETIPCFSEQELKEMVSLSYVKLLRRILPLFISEDEIPGNDLQDIITNGLTKVKLDDVVHLAELNNGLNVLELFHGKTLAFKDIAITFAGQLLEYFLVRRKQNIILVVGTSGDTGSSAIQGVCDSKWIDIVVLLPHKYCSKTQELQMTTVVKDNVHVFCVEGTSDDIDVSIKKVCLDTKFKELHNIGTINSINWARVMIQTIHYFYAYFSQIKSVGELVEVVIPTGALGNATAGCIAAKMGLPLCLVCAVNKNDIVHRAFSTGDYSVRPVQQTLSPSMDIQVAYNIERILWLFSNGDSDMVARLLVAFESSQKMTIPDELLKKIQLVVSTDMINDDSTLKTMLRCWQENRYLLCPHTAVGVAYYYKNSSKREKNIVGSVCLATASPGKFHETVVKAGLTPHIPSEIAVLDNLPTKYMEMKRGQDWESMLREKIINITETRKHNELREQEA